MELYVKVGFPEIIDKKSVRILYFDADFLNAEDKVVRSDLCRARQVLRFLYRIKFDDDEFFYRQMCSRIDCSEGRNAADPSVEKIRLTFYVEFDKGIL